MASKQKAKKIKPKTNKAALKRFKKTKNGRKFRGAKRAHILTKEPAKRKRQRRANSMVKACDVKEVDQLLMTQA